MTNASGQIFYDYSKLDKATYTYKAYHTEDSYYTYINTTGTFKGPGKYNIIVLNNQTIQGTNDVSIKINATIKDKDNNQINPNDIKLLFITLKKIYLK